MDGAGAMLWRLDDVSPLGSAARVTLGNQSVLVHSYEATTGMRASSTLSTLDLATTFDSERLTYEARGLLFSRTRFQQERETFLHDPLGRLEQHMHRGQADGYGYYPNGNLRQKPDIGELFYESAQAHAVTRTADDRKFHYDDDGRQYLREGPGIRLGRDEITYTEFGLPATVRSGTSTTEVRNYSYDAQHERVLETMPTGEETVSWSDMYRRSKDLTGALQYIARMPAIDGVEVELVEEGEGPKTRFAMTDNLGSVIQVADAARQELERRDYQPFGKSSTLLTTRLGFTGHESDVELGLINMRGRIFDAAIGRFLTPDPIIGSVGDPQAWNRYSYVGNNPLNATDPSGFEALCAAPADGVDRGQGCIPLPGPTVGNTSGGGDSSGSGALQGTVGTSSGRGNTGGGSGTSSSQGYTDLINSSQTAAASAVFSAAASVLASLPSGNAINLQPTQSAATTQLQANGMPTLGAVMSTDVMKRQSGQAEFFREYAENLYLAALPGGPFERAFGAVLARIPLARAAGVRFFSHMAEWVSSRVGGNVAARGAGSVAKGGGGLVDDAVRASTAVGRRGAQLTVQTGTNVPATIGGRNFTGHALDQMQSRGFTPTVVENAIQNGVRSAGNKPDSFQYLFDGVKVIANGAGDVVTVTPR